MPGSDTTGLFKLLASISKYIVKYGPVGPIAVACIAAATVVSTTVSNYIIVAIGDGLLFLTLISFMGFTIGSSLIGKSNAKVVLEQTRLDGQNRKDVIRLRMAERAQKEALRVGKAAGHKPPIVIDGVAGAVDGSDMPLLITNEDDNATEPPAKSKAVRRKGSS